MKRNEFIKHIEDCSKYIVATYDAPAGVTRLRHSKTKETWAFVSETERYAFSTMPVFDNMTENVKDYVYKMLAEYSATKLTDRSNTPQGYLVLINDKVYYKNPGEYTTDIDRAYWFDVKRNAQIISTQLGGRVRSFSGKNPK